ncbi:MAG TPA: argininosuccinate synthase [Candidatus Baltobacteraceae bacterium]|jgi:argininosuccinate synthase|nr:argininosuccinate synthase [Candidatus Baltobacteraceae bacterium]
MTRIVLAYSGGLDTSVLLKKLILEGHEAIAMTVDLGESDAVAGSGARSALDAVRTKALALGASDAVLVDAKSDFIEEYAFKALRANALYEGVYPLSAALSRPLIASLLVKTAHQYGATVVAHGCTGKGNDQVRIEVSVRALDPSLVCRAPLRESPLSRPDAIAFAREHGVPVSHTAEKPYSIDANLWGRSIEAGVLEDPWAEPPEDAYAWTAASDDRPSAADEIVIEFDGDVPYVGASRGAALVAELNAIAGKHGVGRIDLIEDRVVGLKSREVYECPGAIALITAHKALERMVLTRDELRFKAICDQKYAELIYDGLWMQPLRDALDAFNGSFAERMTGRVRLKLHHGQATPCGVASPLGLYRERLATYGAGDEFDHGAATGFIALHGLALGAFARTGVLANA